MLLKAKPKGRVSKSFTIPIQLPDRLKTTFADKLKCSYLSHIQRILVFSYVIYPEAKQKPNLTFSHFIRSVNS